MSRQGPKPKPQTASKPAWTKTDQLLLADQLESFPGTLLGWDRAKEAARVALIHLTQNGWKKETKL